METTAEQWYHTIASLPGETRDELMTMAGYVKKSGQDQSLPKENFAGLQYAHTDLGNAERFVHQHKDNIRYCAASKTWYIWDGWRWQEDQVERIYYLARLTMRSIPKEADGYQHDDLRRAQVLKWATHSESRERIRAMVELAHSDPVIAIEPDFFDRDPWLLNCMNGTINLKTLNLQPHSREDYISMLAPVAHDADAVCLRWEQFLDCIFGHNQPLIDYVQRICGYCLTGSTREQDFYFLYGTGANGKSTLVKTLMALLGTDYATQASSGTLWTRQYEAIGEEIAVLQGARLVTAMETDQGKKLAEGLVKQLTGGDRIRARRLYANSFEFLPTFKVFLAANHKPRISGTDNGIWRRIKIIPFTVSIPEDKQDPNLGEILLTELPGILIWALRGCQQWQQQGLRPPLDVTAATTDYRADSDIIIEFLEDKTFVDPGVRTQVQVLYETYKTWAESSGERPLSMRKFNDRVKEKGYQSQAGKDNRKFWHGIGLLNDEADWSDISEELFPKSDYSIT